jgi:pyrroline-5-carboxylate reductase
MLAGGDDAAQPDAGLGAGYGAKLEKDIEQVGAALGMDAAQAKQAAGAFFMTAAKCLMGGGEGDDDQGQPDGDEMIDTGSPGPGRYGA